jgi:hypothetical protein
MLAILLALAVAQPTNDNLGGRGSARLPRDGRCSSRDGTCGSTPLPPQSGLVLWLDGSNVDLAGNSTITDATTVSTWKNRSATTGDFTAISSNATPYANVNTNEGSVSFDGVYDQMVGANSGTPLNFISSTGVFDVVIAHRPRNTENGDSRRIFGTAEGNTGLASSGSPRLTLRRRRSAIGFSWGTAFPS